MLVSRDIRVAYGATDILHGIGFCANPGEFTAIVGPNGSGKTTLMRALTGDVPYSGSASLNGLEVASSKTWELAAIRGVLPQATTLAFPFTVAEVVRLGLSRGLEAPCDELLLSALARVGLAGFEGRFYQELSGGEQQRVQLARVLTQVWHPVLDGQPHWLFLDEPVSSLDIGHQLQVMNIARDYADEGGGVVAVMHDLNLTAMFADSVALISAGMVMAQDVPGEVIRDDLLSAAYHCKLQVNTTPARGTFLLPHNASLANG